MSAEPCPEHYDCAACSAFTDGLLAKAEERNRALLDALTEALPWVAIATVNDDPKFTNPQRTANHARALEMIQLAFIKATTP